MSGTRPDADAAPRKPWRRTAIGKAACLVLWGVALAVAAGCLTGHMYYARVREDTGEMQECVFGLPVRRQEHSHVLRDALAAVAHLPPPIAARWHVVETDLLDSRHNPRRAWVGGYNNASAWTQVDPCVARFAVENLAAGLRRDPRDLYPTIEPLVEPLSPLGTMPRSESGFGSVVWPGWLRTDYFPDELARKGYLTVQDGTVRRSGSIGLGEEALLELLPKIGWSPLQWYASVGDVEMVRRLLAEGAWADATNLAGYTALHLAAQWGEDRAVEELLRSGATVDAKGGAGWTPLVLAAANGFASTTELLLKAGADPNGSDLEGRTSLDFASAFGDADVVGLLLRAGADPNARDSDRWTPLHYALHSGSLATVRELVLHGADTDIRDHLGRTAQEMGAGSPEIVQFLREHMAAQ